MAGQSHFLSFFLLKSADLQVLESLGPVMSFVLYSRWRFSQAHRWQSVSRSFCVTKEAQVETKLWASSPQLSGIVWLFSAKQGKQPF